MEEEVLPLPLNQIVMKKILMTLSFGLIGMCGFAQQDAMFTHYMFNTQAINPAYAGTRDALTITGLHRSQWVGFEGAPVTQTLTGHTPIFNDQLGVGLSIINDKIGPINTTSFYADFAYKFQVSDKGKLSFGLKGGVNLMSGNLSTLELDQGGDNAFANNIESQLLPNFGFGAYYYEDRWYVGLSTPKLMENDFKSNTTTGGTDIAGEKRHYFLIGGAVFDLNKNLKLKPTTFIKVTAGAPIEADLTALLLINDKLWTGPMFRTGDALGALLGYQFTDALAASYSFDWSYTNTTFKYNGGSHEIMLRYDFFHNEKQKIRSPRYF